MATRVIAAQDKTSSGAGDDVQIKAGSANTSGAGGSIIIQPGAQATSGGDGIVIVRQPSGTAGTDEIQLLHNGSRGSIINKDGTLQLGGANIAIRNVANNANTTLTASTLYTTGIYSSDIINADGVVSDSYSWGIDSSSFNWNQGFNLRVGWSHIRGGGYANCGIAYTGNNTNGRRATLEVTDGSTGGGAWAYRSATTTVNTSYNDLNLAGHSAFQRLNATAATTITGIAPASTAGGSGFPTWIHTDGRIFWLYNVGTFNITLANESASSTAGNRVTTQTGANVVLGPGRMMQIVYDGTSSRWRTSGETYPYVFPTTDGTNGQVLTTNGSGALSWTTVSSSSGTVTSVSGTGTVNGITLTGTVTSSGSLTLGGTLSGVSLATQVTGTLPIANGGTSATTATAAFDALNPMTTLGDIIFENTGGTATRLAGNTTTTKQFLSQTGTGTVSAAPSWSTVAKSDVGLANVENTALSTWAGSANITTLGTVGTGTWNATTIGTAKGGTGLTAIGTANQVLGVNSGATGLEYKTLTSGTSISITHGANSVTIATTGLVIGTNVQAWDADLDAIAALAGTTGLLRKTAANTWSLETSSYLTANQTITLSGDVSGSGSTSIAVTLATVPLTKGGTGATTQAGAANAVLPSQATNSGKYLTTDGTNVSWGTVSGGASASGTTNYIAKFTGASALGNSQIFDNGTNVGLGTASPSTKLDVAGGIKSGRTDTVNEGGQIELARANDNTTAWYLDAYGNSATTANTLRFVDSINAAIRMAIDATGNVGIGTSTSLNGIYTPLHVNAVSSYGSILSSQATATVVADSGGELQFAATYRTTFGGGDLTQVARIRGLRENATASNWAGYLAFYTSTGSDSPSASTERMRINSSGNVGVGTTSPSDKLHVIGNVRAGNYTAGGGTYLALTGDLPGYASGAYPTLKSDGTIYLSAGGKYSAYFGDGSNTFGINRFSDNLLTTLLHPGGTSYFTGGAVAFGATTAAGGGQVYVAPTSNTTKGLVVRGAASQSANLQEWQNNGGTALATVNASGSLATSGSITSSSGLKTSYTNEYDFLRAAPTTVGDYVEICSYFSFSHSLEVTAVSQQGAGIGTTIKKYIINSVYGMWNFILAPIAMERQGGYESTFDFELEVGPPDGGFTVPLRLRRTAGTSARNVLITVKNISVYGHDLTPLSGTGTSAISLTNINGAYVNPYNYALPVPGTSGSGRDIGFYAGSAIGTGAGGSIILQPGAQATSGGDGVIQIKSAAGVNSGKLQGSTGDLKIIPESGKNVLIYDGYNGGGTNVIFQTNQSGSEPRVNMGYGVSINSFNFISGSVYAGNYASLTSWNLNLGFRATGAGYAVQSGITGGSAGVLNVTAGDFSAGGSIAFKSNSPSGYTGDQTDLVLNGSAFQRLSGTAARNIFSIAPPSGGSHVDGRMIRIYNVGSFNLTLKHNYTTGTTQANRMFCVQSVDIIIAPNDYAELIYDGTNNGSGAAGWRAA